MMQSFLCRTLAVLLALAMLLSAAACTVLDDKDPEDTKAPAHNLVDDYPEPTVAEFNGYRSLDYSEYLTLPDYKSFSVDLVVVTITDEDVDAAIAELMEEFEDGDLEYFEHLYKDEEGNALVLKEGDKVVFDAVGKIDGVAFQGGTLEYASIELTEKSGYIDGYAEAFIGHKVGETFVFDLAFPEEYVDPAKDPEKAALFNGVTAEWTVTVHYVAGEETVPTELTDEIVQEFFGEESVEAFRAAYKEMLQHSADVGAKEDAEEALWNMVYDGATVLKYPENSVLFYQQYLLNYCAQYGDYYGYSMAAALKQNDFADEDAVLQYAKDWVKDNMVLAALILAENVDTTAGYDEWIAELAEENGTTPEIFKSYYENYYGADYLPNIYESVAVREMLYGCATVNPVPAE